MLSRTIVGRAASVLSANAGRRAAPMLLVSRSSCVAPLAGAASSPSAARSYAAPATPAADGTVKAPIALFGLDGTYATALYTAALKSSTLDATAKAIATLGSKVQDDAKLMSLLAQPTLTAEDKSLIVAELMRLAQPANAAEKTVRNVLQVLAENNRLGLVGGVCAKFGELLAADRGEVEVVVTSAQALDNRTLNRLESVISKNAANVLGDAVPSSGSAKLKVTNKVDPEILGGLVVEIADRTIDVSVASRVTKLNKLLSDSI